MDLYGGHINKLIEELAGLPGIGNKSAQRLAFHLINMPKEKVERLAGPSGSFAPSVPMKTGTTEQLWWSRIRETWRPMKRQESIRAFIMYCMEPFLRCSESARMIFG